MREQRECAEYLQGDGDDKVGARLGLADWTAEEVLMRTGYDSFLEHKSQLGGMSGFAPLWMPYFLFDFQKTLVEWALLKGNDRFGIGIELKPSYYRQAKKNIAEVIENGWGSQKQELDFGEDSEVIEDTELVSD